MQRFERAHDRSIHLSHKLFPATKVRISNLLSFCVRLAPEGKERGELHEGALEVAERARERVRGSGSCRTHMFRISSYACGDGK